MSGVPNIVAWIAGASAFVLVVSVWSIVVLIWSRRKSAERTLVQNRLNAMDSVSEELHVLRLWRDGESTTIEVPGVLSWLAFGDANAPIRGIEDFPEDEVPQGAELWFSFVSFHNMVALGSLFVLITGLGMLFLWRKTITEKKWWLKVFFFAIPLPILACQFGWIAAEVGRQPWIVYGELKTADAASVTVGAGEILFSMILFGLIYACLGCLWLFLLSKKVKHGPEPMATVEGVA